ISSAHWKPIASSMKRAMEEACGGRRRRSHRKKSSDVHPKVTDRLLTAAELIDLNGGDPGLKVSVNGSYACASRAVAQEANHIDYLTYRRKLLAAVFVELVDRIRVLQREPHAVIAPRLGHEHLAAAELLGRPLLSATLPE